MDFISGLAGDDDLTGGGGADTILGQEGDDVLQGNNGSDMLCSGEGDDFIAGNGGNDLIEGQEGNDFAEGDYGNDRVFGNDGEDTVLGGRGMDLVNGGGGDDVIFGGILRGVPLEEDEFRALADGQTLLDVLQNSDLEIDIREDDRVDILRGNQGNDILFVGNGDNAAGGQGNDTFNLTLDDDNTDMDPAQINDYNDAEDTINIVFDAPLSVDGITIEADGDDAVVVVNGEELAVVRGAAGSLTAADISVLTEDSVVGLFDPNA
jgi:Ca2+-binding RTX toxin-like protein